MKYQKVIKVMKYQKIDFIKITNKNTQIFRLLNTK